MAVFQPNLDLLSLSANDQEGDCQDESVRWLSHITTRLRGSHCRLASLKPEVLKSVLVSLGCRRSDIVYITIVFGQGSTEKR